MVPTTTPSVAPNSSPASKYNRKFREINDNIKILMEQRELAKRFNEAYDHINKRIKKQNDKLDALDNGRFEYACFKVYFICLLQIVSLQTDSTIIEQSLCCSSRA